MIGNCDALEILMMGSAAILFGIIMLILLIISTYITTGRIGSIGCEVWVMLVVLVILLVITMWWCHVNVDKCNNSFFSCLLAVVLVAVVVNAVRFE